MVALATKLRDVLKIAANRELGSSAGKKPEQISAYGKDDISVDKTAGGEKHPDEV